MENLTFKPASITKDLLKVLEERPRDMLIKRFGLQSAPSRTLESIGQEYGITRERVRQIESFALNKLRQSDIFSDFSEVFDEIVSHIEAKSSLVEEQSFLNFYFDKSKEQKPHLLFLLVVGEPFTKLKKDEEFLDCWTTNTARAKQIRSALSQLHNEIDDKTILSEKEVLSSFSSHFENILGETPSEEILSWLLKTSHVLAPNALGDWGHSRSPYIRPRSMRDYAFLVMKKHGSPIHFSEAAQKIEELFNKPAHIQTVHNELIKDDRFVLVGRGIYALKEWGYEGGIVREVIAKILSKHGPLPKDEIIKRVLKERHVKENTILVNLQNKKFFKKDPQGNYTLL